MRSNRQHCSCRSLPGLQHLNLSYREYRVLAKTAAASAHPVTGPQRICWGASARHGSNCVLPLGFPRAAIEFDMARALLKGIATLLIRYRVRYLRQLRSDYDAHEENALRLQSPRAPRGGRRSGPSRNRRTRATRGHPEKVLGNDTPRAATARHPLFATRAWRRLRVEASTRRYRSCDGRAGSEWSTYRTVCETARLAELRRVRAGTALRGERGDARASRRDVPGAREYHAHGSGPARPAADTATARRPRLFDLVVGVVFGHGGFRPSLRACRAG
jgi:hypothetical protein